MRKTSPTSARGIGVRFVTPKTGTSHDFDLPRRTDERADDDEPHRRPPPPPGMGKLVDKVV
jgi:hypothetical protein